MFTSTTDVPQYITPDAHDTLTSSTPTSFQDIPPILRYQDDNVEVSMTPSSGWGWNGKVKGRIWVTEAAITFLPSTSSASASGPGPSSGFKLLFPALTLHALTPSSSDSPAHVYCQIDESGGSDEPISSAPAATTQDGEVEMNGHAEVNGDGVDEAEGDDGGQDDFTPMREVRIYVEDSKVKELFDALSRCSALHDSLLPSGEPSSFFGFGDMADGPDDYSGDEDEGDDAEPGQEDGEGGRVRSDFHSGGGPGARFRPY